MLVDKLGLPVTPQQDAEIVEPGYDALELHPVHKEGRDRNLVMGYSALPGVARELLYEYS